MRFSLLAIFLLIPFLHFSQKTEGVEGTVISGGYLGPINKAHIRSGIRSTKTDRKGHFKLELTSDEPLIISHAKFDSQEIPYDRLVNTPNQTFYLTPTSNATSEIIEENTPQEILAQSFEHVLDYTFIADTLIVLTYMHEQHMKERAYINCALTVLKYGEVIQRLVVPSNTRGLRDHPSGDVYLIGPSFAHKLVRTDGVFDYEEIDFPFYLHAKRPVFDQNKTTVYYQTRTSVVPLINYYTYDIASEKSRRFRKIKNPTYFKKVSDDFYMLDQNEIALAEKLESETGVSKQLFAPYIRSYYKMRDLRMPYAPGFIVGDTVAIFDHRNQWLFYHSLYGAPLDSVGIYHDDLLKEELIDLIQDPISEKLYTHHNKAGVHYLREIEIETGSTGRPYQINKPFPKKVKVFEGYVYYLYQTPIENKNWHLLREPLPFE